MGPISLLLSSLPPQFPPRIQETGDRIRVGEGGEERAQEKGEGSESYYVFREK